MGCCHLSIIKHQYVRAVPWRSFNRFPFHSFTPNLTFNFRSASLHRTAYGSRVNSTLGGLFMQCAAKSAIFFASASVLQIRRKLAIKLDSSPPSIMYSRPSFAQYLHSVGCFLIAAEFGRGQPNPAFERERAKARSPLATR